MGGGGKGGGSSYTPPKVPPVPVYEPPKPLPPLPEDPAADYNAKKQQETLASLRADQASYEAKAKQGGKGTPVYTREERKSIGPLG
jgi:hypothetical protein